MIDCLRCFTRDESGAVSIDWMILTAAVVGMSAISFNVLETSAFGLMETASTAVDSENDFDAAPED